MMKHQKMKWFLVQKISIWIHIITKNSQNTKQIRPLKAIEEAQVVVKDSIVESETAKVQSEERLSSIEDAVANIEHEINAIIEKSEENQKET